MLKKLIIPVLSLLIMTAGTAYAQTGKLDVVFYAPPGFEEDSVTINFRNMDEDIMETVVLEKDRGYRKSVAAYTGDTKVTDIVTESIDKADIAVFPGKEMNIQSSDNTAELFYKGHRPLIDSETAGNSMAVFMCQAPNGFDDNIAVLFHDTDGKEYCAYMFAEHGFFGSMSLQPGDYALDEIRPLKTGNVRFYPPVTERRFTVPEQGTVTISITESGSRVAISGNAKSSIPQNGIPETDAAETSGKPADTGFESGGSPVMVVLIIVIAVFAGMFTIQRII